CVPPAPAAADNFQGRIRPTTHWTSQPTNPTSWAPAPNPTTSSPRPTPTATATSSPTRGPLQVSYSVVKKWKTGFHGQFIIVNKGSRAINGWQLAAGLPGDSIHSVWKGQFHTDNDTLYIDPWSSQHRIAPGATVIENFTASGSTRTPTSCTFNGSAC